MTKQEFSKMVSEKNIFLDGATGSMLMKMGMPKGMCTEEWVMEHPQSIAALQSDYADAGSNIVYAPTFSANRISLKEYSLESRVGYLNRHLVRISKNAVGDRALVAGDVTMTGAQLEPAGNLKFEELIGVYRQQIKSLADGNADLIVIETMISLAESRAALIAANEVCSLPVMVTLTFGRNQRTLYGTEPEAAAVVLQSLGADAVGVNCSSGPDQIKEIIKRIKNVSKVPVIAKPNAGKPYYNEVGEAVYDMNPKVYAQYMLDLLDCGADIIGGCCGTTPEYIKELTKEVSYKHNCDKKKFSNIEYISTERSIFNPDENLDNVLNISDENLNGKDEDDVIDNLVDDILESPTSVLYTDISNPKILDAILRVYNGRALYISHSNEISESVRQILSKYGTLVRES